jgi:hypothetical protein
MVDAAPTCLLSAPSEETPPHPASLSTNITYRLAPSQSITASKCTGFCYLPGLVLFDLFLALHLVLLDAFQEGGNQSLTQLALNVVPQH